ncbi:MAG: nucleotidyltransferase domain-containing protein [Halobaculum sp.]
MTRRTVDPDAVFDHLREILDRVDVRVERAIVFGSVARGDHDESSDVDVVLVSADFEGVPGAERGRPFRDAWDYEEFGAVDFLPYTPAEYDRHRDRTDSLVDTAETNGVRLA